MHRPVPPSGHRRALLALAAAWAPSPCFCSCPRWAEPKNPTPTTTTASEASRPARRKKAAKNSRSRYSFYCNGPITGYQLQSQIPVTGIQSPPEVISNATKAVLSDKFSCSGKCPASRSTAWALAKAGYETITGQFAIEHKICAEPREDPLLTVVYATIEKGVVVQAISGPVRPRPPARLQGRRLLGRDAPEPEGASSPRSPRSTPSTSTSTQAEAKKRLAPQALTRPASAPAAPARGVARRLPRRGAGGGLQHAAGDAFDLGDRGEAVADLLQAVVAQAAHAF